eukprot:10369383-Alexandrium_andersonii.AAC.1
MPQSTRADRPQSEPKERRRRRRRRRRRKKKKKKKLGTIRRTTTHAALFARARVQRLLALLLPG